MQCRSDAVAWLVEGIRKEHPVTVLSKRPEAKRIDWTGRVSSLEKNGAVLMMDNLTLGIGVFPDVLSVGYGSEILGIERDDDTNQPSVELLRCLLCAQGVVPYPGERSELCFRGPALISKRFQEVGQAAGFQDRIECHDEGYNEDKHEHQEACDG